MTKYRVSKPEIKRRRIAFLSLSVFLLVSLFLASMILNTYIDSFIYIAFIFVVVVSNIWIAIFFKSFKNTTFDLSSKTLTRNKQNKAELFSLSDISKIKIKRKTNGRVREIYLYSQNGQNIYINGLAKFEAFTNTVIKRMNTDVKVINTREPLDFDSPLFYPILGIILGASIVCIFRTIYSLSYQSMVIVFYGSLIYIVFIVALLIITKPISSRYGR